MPSPTLLPTPQPSTDIAPAKRGSLSTLDHFALPPAALTTNPNIPSPEADTTAGARSSGSYRPISPASPNITSLFHKEPVDTQPSRTTRTATATANGKKRPAPTATASTGRATKTARNQRTRDAASKLDDVDPLGSADADPQDDAYQLPPPPTRARKIIQMRPKGGKATDETGADAATVDGAAASTASTAATATTGTGRGRKGANSGTTAAGRKSARKTAHSLIERRRRSKMNEEFGVLKGMIPACSGQEMHKLAILQAAIEYMRYLENCVTDLKAANAESRRLSTSQVAPAAPHPATRPRTTGAVAGSANPSANTTPVIFPQVRENTYPSPTTLLPYGVASDGRHLSASSSASTSTSVQILSASTTTSMSPQPSNGYSDRDPSGPMSASVTPTAATPLQRPQTLHRHPSLPSLPSLSPNFPPLSSPHDSATAREDVEVMSALLMLNVDRRGWDGTGGRREVEGEGDGGRKSVGMSVRDLLSWD